MGHVINPIFYHLENLKKWVSGKDNIIPSPFVEFSFTFSHVNITRGYELGIDCYFMDSLLKNWRKNVVKQPTLTSSRIFKPIPKGLSGKRLYKQSFTINLEKRNYLPTILVKRMSRNQLNRMEKRSMKLAAATGRMRNLMYRGTKREYATWNVGLRTQLPQKGKAPEMVQDPESGLQIMNPVDYSGKNHYLVYDIDFKSDEFYKVYGSFTTKATPYNGKVPVKVSAFTIEGEPKDQYMFPYDKPRLLRKTDMTPSEIGNLGISHAEYQEALNKLENQTQT